MWIRGFEEEYSMYMGYHKAFNRDNLYSHFGLSFNFKWEVNASYIQKGTGTSIRQCKGYITDLVNDQIENLKFDDYSNNKIVFGDIQEIVPSSTNGKVFVIAPERFHAFILNKNPSIKIKSWYHFLKNDKKVSLSESLKYLTQIDLNMKYDTIYFTVNGLEDEVIILDKFLRETHHSQMIAVVNNIFDLIDLRQ